jgi:hypothetical protein
LSQNNLGLAEDDILARDYFKFKVPLAQAEVWRTITVDQALKIYALPQTWQPDLEIAWQLLNLELFSHLAEETSTSIINTSC